MILHAGLIARRIDGHWRGALIEGPSGAGKSDLALRALEGNFRLVADDRVIVWASQGRLFGRAPDVLSGLLEVRGQELATEAALPFCEIVLAIAPGDAERLPGPVFVEHLGVRLPQRVLAYREASAPAKLGRALSRLYVSNQRRM